MVYPIGNFSSQKLHSYKSFKQKVLQDIILFLPDFAKNVDTQFYLACKHSPFGLRARIPLHLTHLPPSHKSTQCLGLYKDLSQLARLREKQHIVLRNFDDLNITYGSHYKKRSASIQTFSKRREGGYKPIKTVLWIVFYFSFI